MTPKAATAAMLRGCNPRERKIKNPNTALRAPPPRRPAPSPSLLRHLLHVPRRGRDAAVRHSRLRTRLAAGRLQYIQAAVSHQLAQSAPVGLPVLGGAHPAADWPLPSPSGCQSLRPQNSEIIVSYNAESASTFPWYSGVSRIWQRPALSSCT